MLNKVQAAKEKKLSCASDTDAVSLDMCHITVKIYISKGNNFAQFTVLNFQEWPSWQICKPI